MRLPEAVILSGFLVIVLGLGGAASILLFERETNRQMREDAREFESAVTAYQKQYEKLPTRYNGYVDVSYGDSPRFPNRHVMQILMAEEGLGNPKHELNPNQIRFFSGRAAQRKTSGLRHDLEWLDPWGVPYRLVLDTDNNKVCNLDQTIHHGTPAVGRIAVLWSAGPDRIANTRDDVLTWRLLYRTSNP